VLRGFANCGSPLGPLLVRRLERRGGEIDLAPYIHAAGHLLAQPQRDRLDRAQVRGDILADEPITARRALHEFPILIGEVDGEAVDLQLADVPDVLAAETLAHPLVERP